MAGQRFTLTFDAQLNIGQMKGAIGNIQSELNKLQLPQNLTKGISGTLSSLEKEIRNFEVASGKDLGNKNNFNALERSAEKIDSLFKDLQIQARDLGSNVDLSKFFPQSIVTNIQKGKQALEEYNKALKKLEQDQARAQKNLTSAQNKQTVAKDNLDTQKAELEKFQQQYESTLNQIYTKVKMQPENIFDTKSIEQAMQKTEELFAKYKNIQEGVNSKGKPYAQSTKITAARQQAELEQLINTYKQLTTAIPEAEKAQKSLETAYTNATNKVKEMQLALEQAKTATEGGQAEAIRKVFEQLNAAGIDTSGFQQNLAGAQAALEAYARVAEGEAAAALEKFNEAIRDNSKALEDNKSDMDGASNSFRQFNDQVREIDSVKSRIKYFLGLNNVINLVKRAIHGAVDTIKELDKAMTETAVVTDFTVSDMWKQLPEYTKRANELGVTTQAAYEAATLYYQQGLNTNEVNALSVETLKMARIAGLDAAEATDRMTNALRGFNMALDEQSAQRVDDVYSELAANTASNVDEISTAMTKVASLAHSANMEFETTAAFLAQIIETTRESAETAGTALKTVVARFSEVKKLFDEGDIRGQDEEGQVIDVNKVGAALRTAGIDLNKYFLGEVGLDDIFMELASKWDSLTSVQQRYIATQAAGSRQQSRFIALMQDYARTQELVGKAYNAEGASARQFAKTQDSLESKLARLKNAWNEFLMGLTNNVMVKTFVDILTNLLNVVNKLTSAFGEGAGTILKWVTAASAIGGLRRLFADGGLATRVIGGFMGHGLGANKIRETLGLGTFDERGQYSAYSRDELKANRGPTIIGNIKGLGAGLKNFGSKIQASKAWTSAGALGSIFGLEGTAAGIAGLATALGTVTVAATAAAIAIKAMYDASPAGQLKMAEKYADSMADVASSAQKAASKIRNVAESSKEYTSAINNATTVSERNQAIQNRNDYIVSLLEEDATYAQYIQSTFTEGGQLYLTLDEKALATAVDDIAKGAERANAHSQLAEAIAQKQTADYYASKLAGVDLENRTLTTGEGDYQFTYTLSDKEYAKYLGYQNKVDAANIAMQNYATTAAARLVDTSKIGAEFGETIASAIGATFNADEILKSARGQDWVNTLFNWGRSDLEQRYKELYGSDASDLKRADLIDKVAMGEALQEAVEGPIAELTTLFEGRNAKDINTLLESYFGQGDFTSRSMAGLDINNDAVIYQWLDVVDNLDQFEQNIRDLASALGIETGDLLNKIKKQAKEAKKQQAQNIWNTSSAMARGGVSTDNLQKFLNLDFSGQQIFQSLYDSFDAQYFTNDVTESLLQGIKSGGPEFEDWFKNLDLSNPIQAFNQLSQAAKSTIPSIKSTAQALLDAGKSTEQFSASNQLAFLITNDGYDKISESLAKFKEENGEISSSNIEELAESSADLQAILDSGTMSAKALAVALEGIESGEIAVWDLNDAIIAALNSMDDLDGIVQSTIDDLNSFDPGFDENDITGFIQKAYKTISENLEKGAVGNNQSRAYLEKLFGENIFDFGSVSIDEYGRKYEAKIQELTGILEANQENMYSAWQSALGTYVTQSGETLSIFNKDNEVFIEGAQVTTDELVQIVAKATGLGEQWARMMVSDYKNYSPDFVYQQGLIDLKAGIQSWYNELASFDGQKVYDESDIGTLAKLFNVSEEDIQTAIDGLNQSAGKLKGIKWTDEQGQRTAESIKSALGEAGVSLKSNFDGSELFDYNKIKSAYDNLGIPQLFESDFNQILSSGDKFWATFFDGAPQEISIKEGQTAGEAYAEAYQQAVNRDLATQLSDVFKEQFAEFEIQVDAESGLATIQEVSDNLTDLGATETTPTISADASNALATIQSVINSLAQIKDKSVTVTTTYVKLGDYDGATAAGGTVGSYASGSENNKVAPGISLTGEEGPEIVWNKEKGYAYITGQHHPEFQDLRPGDRIFNAQETKKILGGAASGGKVPSFARGYGNADSSSSGSGSGRDRSKSDKEKTPEEWKNELDWLYNLMEDIAELERQQTELEERYEDLLTDEAATGHDLYKLLVQQLGNLYTQLNHQTFALEKREQEMREFMDTTNDKDQYLWYNWEDRTLEIDWDAIDRITDEEEYKHVKELVDEAEDIQDKMDDAEDAIQDIQNQIEELENIWRDTFTDFENRVYEAIVKSYQDVIDNYSELNDTLNNSNQAILDSLQKEISLQRQIRDNTKTEEQIADSEAQLAYMRRDTTGGNTLAALELEKQLAEDRESYEDTLVDQAISRLSEDNSAAAEQREHQIEIMQAQLEYAQENGEYWNMVSQLIAEATGDDGQLLTNTRLEQLLQNNESWDAMSETQQAVWEEELTGTFKEVVAFLLKENSELNGTFYTALTAAVDTVGAAIGSYSQAVTKLGNQVQAAASSSGGGGGGGSSGGSSGGGSGSGGGGSNKPVSYDVVNSSGAVLFSSSSATAAKAQAAWYGSSGLTIKKRYATGGLADYTGPAWLDGTPSEPEYVLNARQTDAFLKLADVLPSVMGPNGTTTNTFGAMYLNFDINVDQLASDYDVDQLVNRIKSDIYDAASYRGVNVLNLSR